MYSVTRNFATTAFIIEREGSAINDNRHLLVETFVSGQSQFMIGRSVNFMTPVTPSFICSNICYLNSVLPGTRFYVRQIPVDSLFTGISEDSNLPKHINLQNVLRGRPMNFQGE